jgi:hypothetical protein
MDDLTLAFFMHLIRNLQASVGTKARGLKGARKLQNGGISIASATTDGLAQSNNALLNIVYAEGVTGTGLASGTSFGSSNTFSPGMGNSQATGAANGFGNSTTQQYGGTVDYDIFPDESIFGNGFGDFAASGGGSSSFGSPVAIPGTGVPATPGTDGSEGSKGGDGTASTPGTPAIPLLVIPALQTGGGGGGFGFTFGGGIGNVSGDLSYSQAYGTAQSAGFGSGQGASIFGLAGGSGGGTSNGNGGGFASLATGGPAFGITSFNGTGGGIASGGAGGYVGNNPNTPVILGQFPIAAP